MIIARAILGKKLLRKLLRTSGHGPTVSGSFPRPRPSPFDEAADVPRSGCGGDERMRPSALASRAPGQRLFLLDLPLTSPGRQGGRRASPPPSRPTGIYAAVHDFFLNLIAPSSTPTMAERDSSWTAPFT